MDTERCSYCSDEAPCERIEGIWICTECLEIVARAVELLSGREAGRTPRVIPSERTDPVAST